MLKTRCGEASNESRGLNRSHSASASGQLELLNCDSLRVAFGEGRQDVGVVELGTTELATVTYRLSDRMSQQSALRQRIVESALRIGSPIDFSVRSVVVAARECEGYSCTATKFLYCRWRGT